MTLREKFLRFALRLILKLPAGLLVRLSGKPPITIAGRVLDPHMQFISRLGRSAPPLHKLSVEAARKTVSTGMALLAGEAETSVGSEDSVIKLKDRTLPIRIYRPFGQDPNIPVMVYFHSGGGVIGDLDSSHEFCALLAYICKGPVISVDYRLAPEHPWPAGLEDAIAAYEWALREADTFGAPPGQASVGGDSMGANFSAIIAQEMKLDHKPQPVLQLLIYPATELDSDTPSMRLFGESFPLTTDLLNWFVGHYLPSGADPEDPRLAPLHSTQMEGLAPAILVTAGFDMLHDQGLAYSNRLHDAGVDVVYRSYNALPHGFVSYMGASPAVAKACEDIAILVRDQLRD
ncbi:MAG: esterase [Ponticaulis sp.]|nr:esterase [Ponticaulis sp.]|tara:strand:- start:10351 stop:11391 length:1041 start_codon:yes stop_codon:yes gene_type:complete